MKNVKKTIIFSLIFLAATVTFFFFWGRMDQPKKTNITSTQLENENKIIARINGHVIYEKQLTPVLKMESKKFKKFSSNNLSKETILNIRKRALDKIISTELLYQEGMKLRNEDIEKKIDRQIDAMNKKNTRELKKINKERIREIAKRNVYIDEYLSRNDLINPKVSEKKIRALYESGKKKYIAPEKVKVKHVLIKIDKNDKPEEIKKARKKIEEARNAILSGKSFGEIVNKYSQCDSVKGEGDLGFIKRGFMPSEFDEVAFSIKPGELSEIIRTNFGFHVLKVLNKEPARQIPYDQLKKFFSKYLQKKESKIQINEHIKTLRQKADIEILL